MLSLYLGGSQIAVAVLGGRIADFDGLKCNQLLLAVLCKGRDFPQFWKVYQALRPVPLRYSTLAAVMDAAIRVRPSSQLQAHTSLHKRSDPAPPQGLCCQAAHTHLSFGTA